MKKKFTWFGVVLAALFSFCLAVVLGSSPSDAMSGKYKALIAAGVIDAVVEPSELGLDYLREQPVDLVRGGILSYISSARGHIAKLPEDQQVLIPLCTNGPLAIGSYPGDGGSCPSAGGDPLYGEALIDSNGKPNTIVTPLLLEMTDIEYKNGGMIPPKEKLETITSESRNSIILADSSGSFRIAQNVSVVNLVVRNPRNNKRYLMRDVNINAFCRDVVNNAIKRTLVTPRRRNW